MFVACSSADAARNGKESLLTRSLEQHKDDDLFDVDDCFAVGEVGDYFVHLVPDSRVQPFVPDWFGYLVIGQSRRMASITWARRSESRPIAAQKVRHLRAVHSMRFRDGDRSPNRRCVFFQSA